ncbi:DUF6419 family natural product biosynthesis protein [Pseudoalteromonas sp. S16_S37]|uniref:DUF6419 family natural product biosynthesis protein n=1 Tax=Pseudoalteromonas sp. S16_S37 TaxID=2720228 RepID=UPI001680945B|nr:DUF6419 family natural product biosynthesis protein [Pseudoalteromonas sp. S16_S37]MBD1584324.1 hypothetical protein [Pseudoalteromonas sp. S16_S37]
MISSLVMVFVSLFATWMSLNLYTPAIFFNLFCCLISAWYGYHGHLHMALILAFFNVLAVLMSPILMLPEQTTTTFTVLLLLMAMFSGIAVGVHKLKTKGQ